MEKPLKRMMIRKSSLSNIFGMARNSGKRPHQGWDLQAKAGTPVYAIADGVIHDVARQSSGDYGKHLTLEFAIEWKTYYAFYAHLSSIHVYGGKQVKEGDLLGYTGKTGNASNLPASEEHLHFEIRKIRNPGKGLGDRVDPGEILGYHVYSCNVDDDKNF